MRAKKVRKRGRVNGSPVSHIDRAIAIFGSENRLAQALGVSQQAFNRAVKRGRVSPELAIAIHRVTKGFVAGNQLRPDLWRKAKDVPIER